MRFPLPCSSASRSGLIPDWRCRSSVFCVKEEPELAQLLQLGQGQVRGVGADLIGPYLPSRRGQAGVAAGPDTVGPAEVRDATIGADAGAREGDQVLTFEYPLGDQLDVLLRRGCVCLAHAALC